MLTNMIIDVHMHLGDILHENGGKTIYKSVKMPKQFNIQRFEEDILKFNGNRFTKILFEKFDGSYTKSVANRIKAGTFENLKNYYTFLECISNKWFGDSKIKTICMPVAPYVTFDDIFAVSQKDRRLLPFTSINPLMSLNDACKSVKEILPNCYGLKLHPIIQGIPFNSDLTFNVLDIFKATGKPVLLHAGASRYYLGKEKSLQHCELDNPYAAKIMIERYPDIPFIIGHAGINEYEEWASIFKNFDNVYIDITVQSVRSIKKLMKWYGEDRMLFATDWPCINPKSTLGIVRKALSDVQLEKIMYRNAILLFKNNMLEW